MINVKDNILIQYAQFTGKEKKIANYILDVELLPNAKDIACKLRVSEATLTRFAKKLHYRGFRELVFHFNSYNKILDVRKNTSFDFIHDFYTLTFNAIVATIDTNLLNKFITKLLHSDTIIILGFGGSSALCSDLSLRLNKCGLKAVVITEYSQINYFLKNLKDNDLVIVMSHNTHDEKLKLNLKNIINKEVCYVFTNNEHSQVHESEENNLILPNLLNSETSPLLPFLILFDIIMKEITS